MIFNNLWHPNPHGQATPCSVLPFSGSISLITSIFAPQKLVYNKADTEGAKRMYTHVKKGKKGIKIVMLKYISITKDE